MNSDILAKLMSITDASQHGIDQTLKAMSALVDVASDRGSLDGLRHAVAMLDRMTKEPLSEEQKAHLHYFRGNAFAATRTLTRTGNPSDWDWHQEEFEQEVTSLRIAAKAAARAGLPAVVQCPILTNLGNALNYVGRFVEAVAWWDAALAMDAEFAMAQGNKGYGLFHYAKALYDDGHVAIFLKRARDHLIAGIDKGVEDGPRSVFGRTLETITKMFPPGFVEHPFETENFPMGRTKGEIRYREWCLRNHLFLNPLNDLGPYPIAARDVFSVPSIVVPIGEGPCYYGLFNQMKQEFVSARFMYYEGVSAERPHFSDRDVLLFDTLDYPCYALSVEKQKLAFRAAYSLFDKIAFFLNHYLSLRIPENRVGFRSLWYNKRDKSRGLRPEFVSRDNWPLRGLFWLAKDLYEDATGFQTALDPDASRLAKIRNYAEHKYLKVHDRMWSGPCDQNDPARRAIVDTLAFSVYREELAESCMRMLRLARAALIYLSLGIHAEERRRASQRPQEHRIGTSPLSSWPDEWKR